MKVLVIVFLGLVVCSQAMELSRAKRRADCAPVYCYVDPCMGVECPRGLRCRLRQWRTLLACRELTNPLAPPLKEDDINF
ncbi:Hypp2437 [Branchiostoma lanceolatum]|uniref:Hypp2437 protein n=1 Tax=Branchiostoma lanceolatum TaxID=7740 RepID=A0A8J9ZTA5_BRALA|nr:Hypp2437 [Branchiostoma lanceolatum]